MTSQSLRYGGIHDSHFEYIQNTNFAYFSVDFDKTCIKINGLLSTLLQDTLTTYVAFPFKPCACRFICHKNASIFSVE